LFETKGVSRDTPYLIIAPKSTIPNWMKEFKNWAPDLTVVNLDPRAEVRNEILSQKMV
jgi:SWI/SNF-related matrix-associated actin-dependent regulator of chromatin subfamily A member 5